MKKQINLSVTPKQAYTAELLPGLVAANLGVGPNDISCLRVVRRSVDARRKPVKVNLGVDVWLDGALPDENTYVFNYQDVSNKVEVLVVGAGPAGLFAALRLIELGLKPVIIERGKDVSRRKRDIAAIHRNEGVNPDSNYGFGEGGAGTFSDGKLFTRSKKRGDTRKILEILHHHGAQSEILIDAHPHIGTNVLPRVIAGIRKTILDCGGEILFDTKVTELILKDESVVGAVLNNDLRRLAKAVILATGHSARDVYYMLRNQGIHLEAKSFAVGVRIEHPQALIDSIQYKMNNRGDFLPPATYSFVEQVNGRGVYSFCMCPGGMIVPAATGSNEMVVNGMSPSERNGKFANSGYVVEVRAEDLVTYGNHRELAGLKFQEDLERKAFKMADNSMFAPAQCVADFVAGRFSASLPATSYHPGLVSSDLHRWMPPFIANRLREAIKLNDRKAKGFHTNDAIVVGVETRTSSPVRIPRNEDTFEHVKIKRLFPCGEGAGYAGGIVSSAVDGERCAEKVAQLILGQPV